MVSKEQDQETSQIGLTRHRILNGIPRLAINYSRRGQRFKDLIMGL